MLVGLIGTIDLIYVDLINRFTFKQKIYQITGNILISPGKIKKYLIRFIKSYVK